MKYDFGQTSHPHTAAVHPNRHFLLIFIWYWRLAVYQKDGALSEHAASILETKLSHSNYQHLNYVHFQWRSPADCHFVNGLIYSSKWLNSYLYLNRPCAWKLFMQAGLRRFIFNSHSCLILTSLFSEKHFPPLSLCLSLVKGVISHLSLHCTCSQLQMCLSSVGRGRHNAPLGQRMENEGERMLDDWFMHRFKVDLTRDKAMIING